MDHECPRDLPLISGGLVQHEVLSAENKENKAMRDKWKRQLKLNEEFAKADINMIFV